MGDGPKRKKKKQKLVSCFHLHWLPDKFWARNRLTSTTFLGNQARVDVSKRIEDLLALLTSMRLNVQLKWVPISLLIEFKYQSAWRDAWLPYDLLHPSPRYHHSDSSLPWPSPCTQLGQSQIWPTTHPLQYTQEPNASPLKAREMFYCSTDS